MILQFELSSQLYTLDSDRALDISIPMDFNGDQPNTYGVSKATARAFEGSGFVGDTRRGGSCNFETYQLTPHCNGTHTECVGHISDERISIHTVLKEVWILSTLITVKPVLWKSSKESYPVTGENDLIITSGILSDQLQKASGEFLRALIVRTLPNDDSKKRREYTLGSPPAYFSNEAMHRIVEIGVEHLLIDLPSIDRDHDEGKLSAHHIFWNVPQGTHDVGKQGHSMKTITEMIFVPNEIPDGSYFLNLQLPRFVADAAPSRPILFPAQRHKDSEKINKSK